MYIAFDEQGVLHVKPETHSDVMTLKWFIKEFSTHGNKMINVATEIEEQKQKSQEGEYSNYSPVENAYGYSEKRKEGWYEDVPPFNPTSFYDNNRSDEGGVGYPKDREYVNRYYVDERQGNRGERGNGRGGRGRSR